MCLLEIFFEQQVFAERVERCQLVELKEATLMIPSGWTHFAYARSDLLVFDGKFMCSFTAKTQFNMLGANRELEGDGGEFRFYTELC